MRSIRLSRHIVSSFTFPIPYMLWNGHICSALYDIPLLSKYYQYPRKFGIYIYWYIVHACFNPSIKELKYNLKIIFVCIDLHLLCWYVPFHMIFLSKKHKANGTLLPKNNRRHFVLHHVLIKTYILNCFYIMLGKSVFMCPM